MNKRSPKKITVWAESSGEAEQFLKRIARSGLTFRIDEIYVAKTSGKSRANTYRGGQYHKYDIAQQACLDDMVKAPQSVIDAVQWCSCDLMIAVDDVVRLCIEDTTHLQGNNLFQRIPRLAKASMLGIPSIIFQGTRNLNLSQRGMRWAMKRYLNALLVINDIYKTWCIALLYHNDQEELSKEKRLIGICNEVVMGSGALIPQEIQQVIQTMRNFAHAELGSATPPITCIQVGSNEVRVMIGVRPDRPSWTTKGSGQMDTYLGLICAAKLLYCYDANGKQVKELNVVFKYLPNGFWWFRDKNKSLYNTVPKEIADNLIFNG